MPPGGGPSQWPPASPPSPPDFGVAPNRSNRRRWVWVGVSLAAVVALVVGLLVWEATSDSAAGGSGQSADNGADRMVGLVRQEDPVCADWLEIGDELAAGTERWADLDKSTPVNEWTAEQRDVFDAAARAMRSAADEFEAILPKAKSQLLKELISQSIVYWHRYLDALSNYAATDGKLAAVASNFSGAVTFVCTAVPLVPDQEGGERRSMVAEPAELSAFMPAKDRVCTDFLAMIDDQNAVLGGWTATDPSVPASQWSPEERLASSAATKVLTHDSSTVVGFSERTSNEIFADLLFSYAAYLKAFAAALPDYVPDDDQLWKVSIYLGGGLAAACEVVP